MDRRYLATLLAPTFPVLKDEIVFPSGLLTLSLLSTQQGGLAVLNPGAVPGSPDLQGLLTTFLVTVTTSFPGTPSSQLVRRLLESRQEKKQFHMPRLGRCPNTHDLGGEGAGRKALQGDKGSKHTEVLNTQHVPATVRAQQQEHNVRRRDTWRRRWGLKHHATKMGL